MTQLKLATLDSIQISNKNPRKIFQHHLNKMHEHGGWWWWLEKEDLLLRHEPAKSTDVTTGLRKGGSCYQICSCTSVSLLMKTSQEVTYWIRVQLTGFGVLDNICAGGCGKSLALNHALRSCNWGAWRSSWLARALPHPLPPPARCHASNAWSANTHNGLKDETPDAGKAKQTFRNMFEMRDDDNKQEITATKRS